MLVSILAWLWVYLLLVIESALVLLSIKIAFDFPEFGARWFQAVERKLSALALRPAVCILAVAGTAFILRGLFFPIAPIPEPTIHDEFSYLLAADTFASGRLANPTHPMWVYFESMQIDQQPTYASMYPPAQGLALALGQRLGNPFYGVWILGAVMCGAICWMLQGWLPPRWALFGAGIAVIRLATFSYWVNSYMLGAVTATGGALVLGALPRIIRAPRVFQTILFALGIALLANSRPYEGAVLAATAILIILYRLLQRRTASRVLITRVIAPLLLVMVPTIALMAYYNWRVFGNALTLPYQANRAAYASAGVFIWDSPKPAPVYRHKAIADFYTGWELKNFEEARSISGFLKLSLAKMTAAWQFYLGPVLTLPLLILPVTFRDRRTRGLLLICGVFVLALFVEAWFMPHYAAPITAAVIALCVQALRHLRVWRWKDRPVGLALVRMLAAVCVLMLGIRIAIGIFHLPVNLGWPNTWATVWTVPLGREKIVSELESQPGRQLVLVRYGPKHDPFREFVFNAADIDGSRIVWARDMGSDRNRELLDYFKDRQVWRLDGDSDPPRLSPFESGPQ